MASLDGKIEVAVSVTGRDEETVRRFYERLQQSLPGLVSEAAAMHAGVRFGEADAVGTALVVRA